MEKNDHVEPMLDTVTKHLEAIGFRFAHCEQHPGFVFQCHTSTAVHTCLVDIHPNLPRLRCLLRLACRVPAEKRQAAAELITRINLGLQLGNFQMDFADGEILYQTAIDVSGGELTEGMVEAVFRATIGTVDEYHPAIMGFLWSDMAPEDAVLMIEAAPAS